MLSAVVIFAIGYFVQTAPWDWDNLKLMVWGYFLILPFLVERFDWALGLSGTRSYLRCALRFRFCHVARRLGCRASRLWTHLSAQDSMRSALRFGLCRSRLASPLTRPTIIRLLLQGRKVVLGYPGHLWTEGFDYDNPNRQLTALMRGAPNWREAAQALGVRYIFWGRDETANYQGSSSSMGNDGASHSVGRLGRNLRPDARICFR